MSLILEALKKSEAERQLGRAPGLTTPMTTVRRRRRSIGPWLMLGVLAAAVGATSWWVMRPSSSDAPRVPSIVATQAPAAAPAEVDVAPDPAATPAVTIPEPALAQTPKLSTAATREVAPRSSASTAASAAPREVKFDPVTPPAALPAPAPLPAEPIATDPKTAAPAAAAPPPASPVETLARLEQLSASERDALPTLKVSMHVWSETPEGRFVLIDGRRYREGEKLSGVVQIVEIRRDGTVLEFNGRRVLLARP